MKSNGLISFLAGITAGAVIGVLFAPASGKETRKKLKKKGAEARDNLDSMIDEGRKEWSKLKGKAQAKADMTAEEVEDFVRYLFSEGSSAMRKLKKEGQKAAKDLEEAVEEKTSKSSSR